MLDGVGTSSGQGDFPAETPFVQFIQLLQVLQVELVDMPDDWETKDEDQNRGYCVSVLTGGYFFISVLIAGECLIPTLLP